LTTYNTCILLFIFLFLTGHPHPKNVIYQVEYHDICYRKKLRLEFFGIVEMEVFLSKWNKINTDLSGFMLIRHSDDNLSGFVLV